MTTADDVTRVLKPVLPTVAEFGAWVRMLSTGAPLEHLLAASMCVVSYARALARSTGRSEDALLLEAAEVFAQERGRPSTEEAFRLVGVDLAEVAQALAEERQESEQDAREVPW